jgi:ectoine hydroxylase-related dioxygenase (phytanoyl-CoA dioxygenase family)
MTSSPGTPPGRLAANGLLESDLWIDRPDAADELARRVDRGEISGVEATHLAHFLEHGYFVFRPAIDERLFDELLSDVDRVWREQPPDAAFAFHSLLTRFSGHDEASRRVGCRLGDFHGYSPAALALYLQPEIHRYARLILDEEVVAKQSIFFQWGSGQALHRDPIHVRVHPASHLVAAWIALEDISAGSGPLTYVPGSHRVPYQEFEPGRYFADIGKDGAAAIQALETADIERCRAAGLEARPFLARRGEVLIWHHSLLHGGSIPTDPEATRKSFVVHLSSLANTHEVGSTYVDPYLPRDPGEPPRSAPYVSRRVITLDGCHGFEDPLRARMRDEVATAARQAGVVVTERTTALERQRAELEARVAAMESSRFWKLRNSWFSIKRAVGLTRER